MGQTGIDPGKHTYLRYCLLNITIYLIALMIALKYVINFNNYCFTTSHTCSTLFVVIDNTRALKYIHATHYFNSTIYILY